MDGATLQSERRVRFSADEQSLRSVQISSLHTYSEEVSESTASQAANYSSVMTSAGRGQARKGALKVRQDIYVASASGGEISESEVLPRGEAQARLRRLVGKMEKAGKLL